VKSPGLDEALENIDIGGPAMLRAAANNFPFVLVLCDPADYAEALERLRTEDVPLEFRRRLAEKAFQHVASYDTVIAQYLRSGESGQAFPDRMTISLAKALDLRYGENPHQRAALYREERIGQPQAGIVAAEKLHGLELSYINVLDADAACQAVWEFEDPAVVIVKHASPCGIATHPHIAEAYRRTQIVYRQSANQMQFYSYHLWAVDPDRMIADMVVKHLKAARLFDNVTRTVENYIPDFFLACEIQALEEYDAKEQWFAHFAIEFQLEDARTSQVVWKKLFDLRKTVAQQEPVFVGRELSYLLETINERLVKELDVVLDEMKHRPPLSRGQGDTSGPGAGPGPSPAPAGDGTPR
jgi:ABC-type uncharacterized transport system auxiliary subunit